MPNGSLAAVPGPALHAAVLRPSRICTFQNNQYLEIYNAQTWSPGAHCTTTTIFIGRFAVGNEFVCEHKCARLRPSALAASNLRCALLLSQCLRRLSYTALSHVRRRSSSEGGFMAQCEFLPPAVISVRKLQHTTALLTGGLGCVALRFAGCLLGSVACRVCVRVFHIDWGAGCLVQLVSPLVHLLYSGALAVLQIFGCNTKKGALAKVRVSRSQQTSPGAAQEDAQQHTAKTFKTLKMK